MHHGRYIDEQAALKPRGFPGLSHGSRESRELQEDLRVGRRDVDARRRYAALGERDFSGRLHTAWRNILRKLVAARMQSDGRARGDAGEEALVSSRTRILLANGPGDPEPCDYAYARSALFLVSACRSSGLSGASASGLAVGAKTTKMKFGTRATTRAGPRHRPRDDHEPEPRLRGRFGPLPASARVTHVSFSTESAGLRIERFALRSVFQAPRASPGPRDVVICSTVREADGRDAANA